MKTFTVKETLNNLRKGLCRLKVDDSAHFLGGRFHNGYQITGHQSGDLDNDRITIKVRNINGKLVHPRTLNGKIVFYEMTSYQDKSGNIRRCIFIMEGRNQEFRTKRLVVMTAKKGVELIFEPPKRRLLVAQAAGHKRYQDQVLSEIKWGHLGI